jgi:predicted aspartyl protease
MKFKYRRIRIRRPAPALGGSLFRPRPLVTVTLLSTGGFDVQDALLDTGADDTVFPEKVANNLGLDLSNAPFGEASGTGSATIRLRFAPVQVRLTDGHEFREWPAVVGFSAHLKQPLLGFAGFLQYFTATFRNDLEEVELIVNSTYPGT